MDEALGKIQAFRRLSPLLASSGQPGPSGIEEIGRAGLLGLCREAHFIQNEHVKGRYRDTLIYALTETEYWSRPA